MQKLWYTLLLCLSLTISGQASAAEKQMNVLI